MNRFFFTFDKTVTALALKKKFLKRYNHYSMKQADVIVVGGGDGFMLHTLKKFVKFKKPFFWNKLWDFWFFDEQKQPSKFR